MCLPFADGVVTLTSSGQGAICPGDEVTLTCNVTGAHSLEWSSAAFNPTIRYYFFDSGYVLFRGIFTATLTSVTQNPNSYYDLSSTLRVTATPEAMLNGTVIICTDRFRSINTMTTLTLAGKYSNIPLISSYLKEYAAKHNSS